MQQAGLHPMVQIEIYPTELIIHVAGADKFFALKSQLTIPLVHVVKAEVDPTPAQRFWNGWRLPGTSIPGLLTAGSFYNMENGPFAMSMIQQRRSWSILRLNTTKPSLWKPLTLNGRLTPSMLL